MARANVGQKVVFKRGPSKRTSIGDSHTTRSKHKRSTKKRSRGQGHPR